MCGTLDNQPEGKLMARKEYIYKFDEQHMAKWFCAKASVDLSGIMRNNFLKRLIYFVIHGKIIY